MSLVSREMNVRSDHVPDLRSENKGPKDAKPKKVDALQKLTFFLKTNKMLRAKAKHLGWMHANESSTWTLAL